MDRFLREEVAVPTVLVVDDLLVDRRLAGALLEKQLDCKVDYAANGREALDKMAAALPDLVLSDLQMPEMDGLELVQAVKDEYSLVPIVLMTAQGSEDIAAQALRLGAASYVPKKKLAQDLAPTVLRILTGSQADRQQSLLMHYLESSEAVFELANDLPLIKALVNHIMHMLRCLPLGDETERLRVAVAVEEALLNAYYHGNLEIGPLEHKMDRQACEALARQRLQESFHAGRRIRVAVKMARNEARFIIRDQGPGFDVARFSEPAAGCLPDEDTGRGIYLMRAIMDEVIFNPAGNEVTLIKKRLAESLDDESGHA